MSRLNNAIGIVGIHTGIGKTVVSAVVAEALGAHYWKPVQAGLEERDSDRLRSLITDGNSRVHPEAIALTMPASPHTAAAAEGISIDFTSFHVPDTATRPLVIETAGGVLSPVTHNATVADMIAWWQVPVILVAANYLGSINHTLAGIEVLRARDIAVKALIFSGNTDNSSEAFIEHYAAAGPVFRVSQLVPLTAQAVAQAALAIRPGLVACMGL